MKNRLNLLHLRLLALFGAFALAVASFIAYLHDETAGLYCAAILLCYLVFLLALFLISRKSAFQEGAGESLSNLTIDFLSKLVRPSCWFRTRTPSRGTTAPFPSWTEACATARLLAVLDGVLTLDRIKAKTELNDASPLELRFGERSYSVSYFRTDVSKKDFYLTIWSDVTELTETKLLLRQKNVLVAYIVVDNMSEITQGIPGQLPRIQRQDRRHSERMGRVAQRHSQGV